MVRAYPAVPQHVDPVRITAWSAAIALHLLAFLLLIIPAAYVALPLPREAPQIRWITPEKPLPPTPVPPADPVAVVPPQTSVQPLPTPLPLPPAVINQAPVLALPASTSAVAAPQAVPSPTEAPAMGGAGAYLSYRSAPPPSYPIAALRNQEQGTVLLRVEVDANGQPTRVTIERSSGSRALDTAARQQVLRRWTFEPSMRDGVATASVGLVPIDFSLPQ
ncbi:energy transducer TonB [Stenotrophomonas sp. CFBP 13725]|uniref:energy transducer TonB n=1 Tax=Stenotrophomonas sp. CFBP 13725 TaxID=2775297 RepID=UPI00177EF9D3|nr:energy transducer TonB [Stenotrophomonas sp. CFBP 13725]MBD8636886.1 TonB family protein [Stenotrophomonas sp. CFBP 13725]